MLRLLTTTLLTALLASPLPAAMAAPSGDAALPTLGDSGAGVSRDEAYRLGRAWLRQFRAQTRTWQDPITRTYVASLVARLLPYSHVGNLDWTVTLVDSRLLNAFAVPGGVIGVNQGLFAFADSEDAFASVLAHELGHLGQDHFARRKARAEETQLPTLAAMLAGMVLAAGGAGNAGMAAMAGSQAAFIQDQLAYSRRFEQEADRVGLQAMADAGFDPQAMPAMFRAMQRLTSLQGGNPPEFLLTHPVTQSRISDTQARADQLPSPPATDDDPRYAMIRARALLALYADDPGQAMARLREGKAPPDAQRYLKALTEAADHRTTQALRQLDSLAEQWPDLALIPATAAEVALAAGDLAAAASRADRLLQLMPDYYPAQLVKARIQLQDDPAAAFERLRDMSRQYPETPRVFDLLAAAAGRSGHSLWGMLARAEELQLTGHIDRAIKQLDIAEEDARRAGDFAMAGRFKARRRDYLDYRNTLQQF
ncbi:MULTISPECIES: M48 family metallopeptidase [Modicisalibacter]|uniref:Putative beta-barrel assembly-enhancing protease n=1 Tax=Modicisalibacter tunisiensis TaxID=390637 RepID=A0ABS7WVV4_9GAMM|nr:MULTISPECIES: M48 family metalloprotease [Modicisalibacter]MBZ9566309.1 M48 family metalloprotease [Modicisalibacter tunisiensis]